jgi:DnaJ-class molecular chaperone
MNNADWANKDFYKVLGVAKDADPAAIKKAYRKLARENHPDGHPGDKAAEDRFKAVAEAYDVVGDADKRKQYDEMRSMFAGAGGRGAGSPPGSAAAVRAAPPAGSTSRTCSATCSTGVAAVVASAASRPPARPAVPTWRPTRPCRSPTRSRAPRSACG